MKTQKKSGVKKLAKKVSRKDSKKDLEEGFKAGLKESREEIARNALAERLPIEVVSKITGLKSETIQKLSLE